MITAWLEPALNPALIANSRAGRDGIAIGAYVHVSHGGSRHGSRRCRVTADGCRCGGPSACTVAEYRPAGASIFPARGELWGLPRGVLALERRLPNLQPRQQRRARLLEHRNRVPAR